MPINLMFIYVTTILFIAFVFTLSSIVKMKQKTPPKSESKTKQKKSARSDEVIDTLDWMLVNGIIDHKEYNKLMGKCLQYL